MANRIKRSDIEERVRVLNNWTIEEPSPTPDTPKSFHLDEDARGIGLYRVHETGSGIVRVLYPDTKRATLEKVEAMLTGMRIANENHHK